MLTLEKNKHREINIAMRSKERLCNATFLKALGIAFAIHLIGFVLFQVGSFITESDLILPPSLVESDIHFDTTDNFVSANFEKETVRKRDSFEPPLSAIKIPTESVSALPQRFDKTLMQSSDLLVAIEEDWEHILREAPVKSHEPIQIHISGVLAELELLKNGISNKLNSLLISQNLKTMSSDSVKFMVQVEHMTGRIFWRMQTKSGCSLHVNQLAETILNEMCFATQSTHFVTSGEIEICFERT